MTTTDDTIREVADIIEQAIFETGTGLEATVLATDRLIDAGLLRQEMTEERRLYTNANVVPGSTTQQRRYVTEWEEVP